MGMKKSLPMRVSEEVDHFELVYLNAWRDRHISEREGTCLQTLLEERVKPTARASRDAKAIADAIEHAATTRAHMEQLIERNGRRLDDLPEPLPAA